LPSLLRPIGMDDIISFLQDLVHSSSNLYGKLIKTEKCIRFFFLVHSPFILIQLL